MRFNLVRTDDTANITVIVDGEMHVADDNHPLFEEIVARVVAGDESAVELFDASRRAASRFENVSDRVQVANSRVYVDQTEVDDVFAEQIIRFMDEGVDDWKPLVLFLEKVYSNVDASVRDNLSRWLKAEEFSILPNGNILGYRGLKSNYTSRHAGPGIVNGVRVNGHLDNSVGNVLEIDSNLVENNPAVGCASGLHVGTYAYAHDWAGFEGVMVSVEVDPRHVRSVPFECNSSKMRVSKYTVLDTVEKKFDSTVVSDYSEDDNEFDSDAAYDEGYQEGHADGVAEGYDNGHADGYREGYDDGLDANNDEF